MKMSLFYGFVFLLCIVFFAAVCSAEQPPSLIAQVYGGESSITNDTDGMIVITIKDVDSRVNVTRDNEIFETSVDFLTDVQYPVNAALQFSNDENKSVSMVNIANVTISEENKTLTLRVTPLQFYEGIFLQEFANMSISLDHLYDKTFNETRIDGEITEDSPSNSRCDICKYMCSYRSTIRECNEYCRDDCS